MTESPKKPLALVTGASRGIGTAIARKLASEGFPVLVNYASSEDRARQVVDAITASGGSAELCGFNVASSEAVDEAIDRVTKAHGAPLAVLVNNAGITIDGLLMRLKDEDLDKTLDVDLKGAIYCTRAATRAMMRARAGRSSRFRVSSGRWETPARALIRLPKRASLALPRVSQKSLDPEGLEPM